MDARDTNEHNNRGLEMKLLIVFVLGLVEGAILLDWLRSRQALLVKRDIKKELSDKKKKGWLYE